MGVPGRVYVQCEIEDSRWGGGWSAGAPPAHTRAATAASAAASTAVSRVMGSGRTAAPAL